MSGPLNIFSPSLSPIRDHAIENHSTPISTYWRSKLFANDYDSDLSMDDSEVHVAMQSLVHPNDLVSIEQVITPFPLQFPSSFTSGHEEKKGHFAIEDSVQSQSESPSFSSVSLINTTLISNPETQNISSNSVQSISLLPTTPMRYSSNSKNLNKNNSQGIAYSSPVARSSSNNDTSSTNYACMPDSSKFSEQQQTPLRGIMKKSTKSTSSSSFGSASKTYLYPGQQNSNIQNSDGKSECHYNNSEPILQLPKVGSLYTLITDINTGAPIFVPIVQSTDISIKGHNCNQFRRINCYDSGQQHHDDIETLDAARSTYTKYRRDDHRHPSAASSSLPYTHYYYDGNKRIVRHFYHEPTAAEDQRTDNYYPVISQQKVDNNSSTTQLLLQQQLNIDHFLTKAKTDRLSSSPMAAVSPLHVIRSPDSLFTDNDDGKDKYELTKQQQLQQRQQQEYNHHCHNLAAAGNANKFYQYEKSNNAGNSTRNYYNAYDHTHDYYDDGDERNTNRRRRSSNNSYYYDITMAQVNNHNNRIIDLNKVLTKALLHGSLSTSSISSSITHAKFTPIKYREGNHDIISISTDPINSSSNNNNININSKDDSRVATQHHKSSSYWKKRISQRNLTSSFSSSPNRDL